MNATPHMMWVSEVTTLTLPSGEAHTYLTLALEDHCYKLTRGGETVRGADISVPRAETVRKQMSDICKKAIVRTDIVL